MTDNRLVVAITGASSGLGRATAHAFASRGASLLLIARGETQLENAAEECRELGAKVIYRSLDVSDRSDVEEACAAAVATYGRVDVWINCAAVLLLSRFEQLTVESFERVVQTNLSGYFHGSQVAIAQFREQGGVGILINVASVLGLIGEPNASAYVATKFAIRGMSACLREEMRSSADIHVCTVLPGPLDTPVYQNCGNFPGKAARSIFPVYDPRRAARKIVDLTDRPRGEIVITGFGQLVSIAVRFVPRIAQWAAARGGASLQFREDAESASVGNLFSSKNSYAVDGGWRKYWQQVLTNRLPTRPSGP